MNRVSLLLSGMFFCFLFSSARTGESQWEGKTLNQWIAQAKDANKGDRLRAVEELSRLGSFSRRDDSQSDTRGLEDRVRAARAMGDTTAAVLVLPEMLRDKDQDIRVAAFLALQNFGPQAKAAVPALTELLRDKDEFARLEATNVLCTIGPDAKAAVPTLIELIHDGRLHQAVVGALGGIGPEAKAAVPVLTELLQSNNDISAAIALGGIGPEAKAAVPALTKVLQGKDKYNRIRAAEALVKIDPNAIAAVRVVAEALAGGFYGGDAAGASVVIHSNGIF